MEPVRYTPAQLAAARARAKGKAATGRAIEDDVLTVDDDGLVYVCTYDDGRASQLATRLVRAKGPERAMAGIMEHTGTQVMKGAAAWVTPLAGVHHFRFTDTPDVGLGPVVPQVTCPRCKGRGYLAPRQADTCPRCGGTGRVGKPGAEPLEVVQVAPRWVQQPRPITDWPGGLLS